MLKYTDNINASENNIAYLSETCNNVSSAMRKKLHTVDDYEVGEILLCRTYIKLNKGKVNFQVKLNHNIVKIEGGLFTLSNVKAGEEQHLGDKIIKYSFVVCLLLYMSFNSRSFNCRQGLYFRLQKEPC